MSYNSDPHGGAPGTKMSFPDDASPVPTVKDFDRPAFAQRNSAAEPNWNTLGTGYGEKVDWLHGSPPAKGAVPTSNGPEDGGNTRYASDSGGLGDMAGGCTTNVSAPTRQSGSSAGGQVAPPGPDNFTPKSRKPRT